MMHLPRNFSLFFRMLYDTVHCAHAHTRYHSHTLNAMRLHVSQNHKHIVVVVLRCSALPDVLPPQSRIKALLSCSLCARAAGRYPRIHQETCAGAVDANTPLSAAEMDMLCSPVRANDLVPIERRTITQTPVLQRAVRDREDSRLRVSRRLRRSLNEAMLREAAQSEEDKKSLFDIQPRTASAFQQLLADPEAQRRWRSFSRLSEDRQARVLHSSTSERASVSTAKTVDARVRTLLKDKLFLRPLVENIEEQVRSNPPGSTLTLVLSDSLSRFVAHSIAQFYQLPHKSVTVGRERVICIASKPDTDLHCSPRLLDVVA